jgi:tetratricopeptide (TPR) repeat protein
MSIATAQLALPAHAQNYLAQADTDKELRRTPERILEIEKTKREAEQQRNVLPARTVTYADVLANPDDIELNLAYARNQIATGNVLGAAATFERILLIRPDHARARLLYAIMLFRLDNLQEAERELNRVREFEMPPSLRAEIDRYLDRIRLRRKTVRYAMTVSVGGQYDWNRNAAPASNRLLVAGLTGTVADGDIRTQDHAYNALIRLEADYDLGYQARHRLKGAVSHYRADQRFRKELDLQVSSAEIALVGDATPFTLIPTLYAQRITLANDLYGFTQGVRLRGEYQYDADTGYFGFGQVERQTFFAIETSTAAPERSGRKFTFGLGVNYTLNPTMKISVEANDTIKHAQRNFNAYRGQSLKLSHNWLLGKGMFLITTVTGELDRYQTGDPTVSGLTRRDRSGTIGMTFGVPLDTLINADVPNPVLRDLYVTVSVSARRQLSNITNFTYNNRTASILFSKRWEF